MNLAVIKTGGKQYLVKAGEKIRVEKLKAKKDGLVEFDTLLLTDEEGHKLDLGHPTVSDKVGGKIISEGRSKKVLVVKYKSKIRYRKRVGHRQAYTQVQIEKI